MVLALVVVGLLAVGAYLLFRDTMNKIQYLQCIRLYWITRDVGEDWMPFVSRGEMRQTAEPWWRGKGIQFRVGKYTFQVGVLTSRGSDLLDQLGGRDLDMGADEIRDWASGRSSGVRDPEGLPEEG